MAAPAPPTTEIRTETNMKGVHEEIRKVSDVLIKLAEMRGDYRVMDQRLLAVEKHVDELRRGDGFIRGQAGIDREFS